MLTSIYFLFIFFLSFSFKSCSAKSNNALLLNALDAEGLFQALRFIHSMKELSAELSCNLFAHEHELDALVDKSQLDVGNVRTHHYSRKPLKNLNIGRLNPPDEKVTSLMESFEFADNFLRNTSTVMIAFSKTTGALPTQQFMSIFDLLVAADTKVDVSSNRSHILLLEKTQKLTSFSDWHDLMVLGLGASSSHDNITSSWISTFRDVFYHHGNRSAFTLLDPRPAMLEASARLYPRIRIGVLTTSELCVMRAGAKRACVGSGGVLRILCGAVAADGSHEPDHACAVVNVPISWKHTLGNDMFASYSEMAKTDDQKMDANVMEAMWAGVLRFRNASTGDIPRDYCWDTG